MYVYLIVVVDYPTSKKSGMILTSTTEFDLSPRPRIHTPNHVLQHGELQS